MQNNQKSQNQPTQDFKTIQKQGYSNANFWDVRYAEKGGFFDWYAEYPQLKNSFQAYGMSFQDKILMVGCGNSKLSQQMYDAGYKNVINIDISPSVIEQMKKQFPNMVWEVMDATKMIYETGTFDAIIDKGTMDALISGKNLDICHGLLAECARVTKDSGQIILITYGSPQGRRAIFEKGLPFTEFDYYHYNCFLNETSTMINLMRSNAPEKGLGQIMKDAQIFQKSMKQYMILKMLRKNRKQEKKYVVWNQCKQSKLEINQIANQVIPEANKVQEEPKKQEKKEQVQNKTEKAPTKFDSQIKKQTFVYVYSIRRKFASKIDEIIKNFSVQQINQTFKENVTKEGNKSLTPITIYTNQNNFHHIKKSIKFLEERQISYSSFLLTDSQQKIKNSLKVSFFCSNNCQMYCFRKDNISLELKVQNLNALEQLTHKLKKLTLYLINKFKIHPCPKAYALFTMLKAKIPKTTVNSLLEKYWFPTSKILNYNGSTLNLKISLPPFNLSTTNQHIEFILNDFKQFSPKMIEHQQGFISYPDLSLMTLLNIASMSYIGNKFELVIEEFWQKDDFSVWQKQNQKQFDQERYNEIQNVLSIPEQLTSKIFAHILALY